jgi:hypothetical protein
MITPYGVGVPKEITCGRYKVCLKRINIVIVILGHTEPVYGLAADKENEILWSCSANSIICWTIAGVALQKHSPGANIILYLKPLCI